MLQDTQLNPANIAVCLTEKKIGFSLDNADLVITISLLLYILLISFYIIIFFKYSTNSYAYIHACTLISRKHTHATYLCQHLLREILEIERYNLIENKV